MAVGAEGNVKWVDGLRGFASLLVLVKHVAMCFFPFIMWPARKEDEDPFWFQLPFIRFPIQGRIGVAAFCLVTGYVSAIKPVKCFVQGNHNAGYAAMSKSAIRRIPRLLIPVALIVLISGIATQLGAFQIAKHCDGYGMAQTSPEMRPNIFAAFKAMYLDYIRVWTHHKSEYGPELWTMLPICKGAFWIYVYLVTTAHVQQRWRVCIVLGLYFYRWAAADPYFGMQFFFGAFLAELQNLDPSTFSKAQQIMSGRIRGVVSTILIVLGVYIASLPDTHHDWQAWSLGLRHFLRHFLPENPDYGRYSSGIGLDMIGLAFHLSPLARTILSNRFFLFLGRMSFAVYLLHNQLLRSVLLWMVYGMSVPAEGEPKLKFDNPIRLFMCIPVYLVLTYGGAFLWTTYVDAFAGRMAERAVGMIKEETNEKSAPLLPQHDNRPN
jgi:peptidoglycan/LPS O-acetylase OafA/YrhL